MSRPKWHLHRLDRVGASIVVETSLSSAHNAVSDWKHKKKGEGYFSYKELPGGKIQITRVKSSAKCRDTRRIQEYFGSESLIKEVLLKIVEDDLLEAILDRSTPKISGVPDPQVVIPSTCNQVEKRP